MITVKVNGEFLALVHANHVDSVIDELELDGLTVTDECWGDETVELTVEGDEVEGW
jgi:hypothetical protein